MPAPQDVTFPSRDPQIPDAKLAGWWIPGADAQGPAVVLVHGVQSCRRESSVLLAASMLHRAGFSVFLMDLRDHGDSQGDDARFAGGSEEYMDVLGGWDWVRAQGVPAAKIGIAGFSFGSISSIVAGSQEPQVAAVFADSSTTRMGEGIGLFVADQLKDGTGLSKILVPGTIVWARLIANDDLTKYDPIDEVAAYARPAHRLRPRCAGQGAAVVDGDRAPRRGRGRRRRHAGRVDRPGRRAHPGDLLRPHGVRAAPGLVLHDGARRPVATGGA